MIERSGSIWTYDECDKVERQPGTCHPWIVIPTNGERKAGGDAVMGAGVAKEAATRFRLMPMQLGARLHDEGNHVFFIRNESVVTGKTRLFRGIATFPTKDKWKDRSTPALIERSAEELADLVEVCRPAAVILPRVGTGLGGLGWAIVKPILEKYLKGDIYVVVTP